MLSAKYQNRIYNQNIAGTRPLHHRQTSFMPTGNVCAGCRMSGTFVRKSVPPWRLFVRKSVVRRCAPSFPEMLTFRFTDANLRLQRCASSFLKMPIFRVERCASLKRVYQRFKKTGRLRVTNGSFTGEKRPLYATETGGFLFFSAYMVKTGN